jgi:voltage-gated potassium channel
MSPSLLALERWRAFWVRLKAENIPRLGMLFIACVLVAGVAEYEIETGRNEAFQTLGDGLWWAVVTLTTTGYGDKFPITTPGRLMATVAMLLGMGVVATVTAKIASVMVERRIKEARGLSEATPPSGHLVILGWKPDMPDFVKGSWTSVPSSAADGSPW